MRREGSKTYRLSLTWRFFLAFSTATWAILSVYFVYDVRTSSRRLAEMERGTLEALFPAVQRILETVMLSGGSEHILGILSKPGWREGLSTISLLDTTKKAVDVSDISMRHPARRSTPPYLSPKMFVGLDFEMRAKAACLRCHRRAREGDLLGYVRLVAPHFQKGRVIAEHFRSHLLVLLAMLVLIGLSVVAVVRWLVQRPLDRVVDAMRRVAAGGFDTRIADPPGGEIGVIARGFNEMASELERDRGEIVDLHRRQVAHMERLVAVGDLAAHLAHEVRNPLTGIGSAVQVMQRETPPESPRQRVLGQILEQLQRMDRVMANFLQYARMPEAVVKAFPVEEPLQRVLFLIEPRLKAQKVELRRSIPAGLPALMGDPGQLEQVFLNVCLNAVQAMPAGGTLSVDVKAEQGSFVLVEVSDTGGGIAHEDQAKVFHPYFTTKEQGSGMGLPISRQIVLAHGGEIWLESVPGRGTSVFVRLPLPGPAQTARESRAPAQVRDGGGI
ncbi:MAG: HAMP domain-containing protein [Elusimicrobia bacterium]|nr:HAMP domain-containing protein [Elusimicrobiota bacterium]